MATGLFTEKELILLPSSPSLQFNNLSNNDKEKFCYIHVSDVVVISKDRVSKQLHVPNAELLYQAVFTTISGTEYIVVASNVGIHLWTSDVSTMLCYYCFEDPIDSDSFLRGIAGGYKNNIVAVGSSTGDVLVFEVSSLSSGSNQMLLQRKLSTDKFPIISLVASNNSQGLGFIASNEAGDIFGFDTDKFSPLFRFQGAGTPCTSLILRDDVLISSYSTGCIRVYRLNILEMSVELAAHGGCINALAIHPQLDIFASCSDVDQTVCIFSFPTFMNRPTCNVELLSCIKLENRLLTGLGFISNDSLAVTCYDNLELGILRNLK